MSSGGKGGVSPGRKAFSTIMLIVLLVVLGIELRAGLGVSLSENALKANAKDGIITGLSLEEAKAKMMLWPTSEVDDSSGAETSIRYTWYSLLRPVIGKPPAVLYLVGSKGENAVALSYHGELTDEDIAAMNPDDSSNVPGPLPANGPVGAAMGGGGGGDPRGAGMGGMSRDPRDAARQRPAVEGEGGAAEGSDPAAEGATPAAEGATPAAEGATPATDGAAPAAEGEKPADAAPAAEQPAADSPAPKEGENPQP
ncbi:MAG: hypothetical protein JNL58_14050 [Planctomyces sp.]|nr:hypothetical protein [Planctomyces sp.]